MNIIFNEQFHDEQNGGSFVPIYDSTIKYLLKFGIGKRSDSHKCECFYNDFTYLN